MRRTRSLLLFGTSAFLVMAASQPWKDKTIPDWSDEDVRLVLNDSPWSKTVEPTIDRSADNGQRRPRGMGRDGINLGGIGIGLPGIGGMGRRDGYPGGTPGPGSGGTADSGPAPALRVRWESALPVRAAEMKSHDSDSPSFDENHYAIAVYGVPGRFVPNSTGQLKKQAAIQRDGKPDIKPSSVEVWQRNDGAAIVYLFPRSKEITRRDQRVKFGAKIGQLGLTQPFVVDEMMYQGKLEL